jgi:hypothetical protein
MSHYTHLQNPQTRQTRTHTHMQAHVNADCHSSIESAFADHIFCPALRFLCIRPPVPTPAPCRFMGFAEGAETRLSPLRKPLPEGYRMLMDGMNLADIDNRWGCCTPWWWWCSVGKRVGDSRWEGGSYVRTGNHALPLAIIPPTAHPLCRFANLHVVNTLGVPEDQVKPCIECWCKGTNPPIGSVGCCSKCNTTTPGEKRPYYLQFNVTYR